MQRSHEDIGKLTAQLIHLDQIDEDKFRSNHLLQGRMFLDAIYGGQAFATAVRAGSMTVGEGFLPNSGHTYFIKAGDVNKPVDFSVKRVRDGTSFCTRIVEATQGEELLTSSLVSFHIGEEPAIQHQVPMKRDYPDPESLKSWQEVLEDAAADSHKGHTQFHKKMIEMKRKMTPALFNKLFDIRPIDPLRWSMRTRYPKELSPVHHIYIRAREPLGSNQLNHRILAAFLSDISMMETALVDHIASGFFPTMLFSLDMNAYFHNDVDANEWLLIETTSPIADGGRAFAEARAWSLKDQKIVLSVTQEGIVRLAN
ncbi:Acyl-coenzyme A thioesterase 8 [Aphelenchoides fujianensis]|nr:Acyl-coenzyme A thioesterase 8 [Aphelenchoides fujianensis]